jgi:hypothetical protein
LSSYTQATVSVTSATVPVSIIPPGDKISYSLKPRAAGAVPILFFFYSGTLPGSAPSNVMELVASEGFSDFDPRGSFSTDAMGQGIAAILESGSTAVTVDAIWK